jgi:hypothetical protein
MSVRILGTLGFALAVLAVPVVANAQDVVRGDQEGVIQVAPVKQTDKEWERQVARAQNRVNRYFREVVATSKLRECWSHLQGRGGIAFDFDYKRSGEHWAFEKLELIKSNLPAGQDEIALRCMQESIGTTSFPVEKADLLEAHAKALVVKWAWPVPLPPKGAKTARISKRAPVSGLPDSLACEKCEWSRLPNGQGAHCVPAPHGGLGCRPSPTIPNYCEYPRPCMTGAFGTSGNAIMY